MYKQFLSYIDGKSFLHKLDPRTKIITLMILSLIIFSTNRTWSLISLLILFIAVAWIARVPIKKLFLSVKPMLFFIGLIFLLHFLFMPAVVFSDVASSVHMMDEQINQFNERHVVIEEDGTYRIQYFDFFELQDEYEEEREERREEKLEDKSEDELEDEYALIHITQAPSDSEVQNAHVEIWVFRVEKIPFDQIPEEKLKEYAVEDVVIESTPAGHVHLSNLSTPAGYKVNIASDRSFFLYPSTYSFITGLGVAAKFILLILFASLTAATTKQSALIQGIEHFVRPLPLKWANLTSHDLALMVFLTIRFIPLLISTSSQIKASSRSRAFVPSKNPFRAIKIISTALINSIIHFADDVSRAMLNRGYTGVGKTSMNELKFKKRDGVFFCSFVLVMFSIIMIVGWLQLSIGINV